jgi:hypothetical protein
VVTEIGAWCTSAVRCLQPGPEHSISAPSEHVAGRARCEVGGAPWRQPPPGTAAGAPGLGAITAGCRGRGGLKCTDCRACACLASYLELQAAGRA